MGPLKNSTSESNTHSSLSSAMVLLFAPKQLVLQKFYIGISRDESGQAEHNETVTLATT